MKSITQFLIIMMLLSATPICTAQNAQMETEARNDKDFKLRPFRIGAKLGFPNLVGGNIEYVTPLLNKRLAVSVDYSNLKSDWFLTIESDSDMDVTASTSFIEGGLNYYLFKPGRGLYAGVGYHSLSFEATTTYYDGAIEYINETHDSFAVKLGAKLGGLFYFRPEIGYAFSSIPTSYQVQYTSETNERETYREELDTDGVPAFLLNGFIANIGFGFAF